MNRTFLAVGLGLLVLTAIGWLGFRTLSLREETKRTAEHRQRLPSVFAYTVGGTGGAVLPLVGKRSVVVYFHPDCEHCQYEARTLRQHGLAFAGAQVVFLSTEPLSKLEAFAARYGLDQLTGVTVAHIEPKTAHETLGFRSVPHLLIYDANGTLRKEFRGETKWEAVWKYL